MSKKSKVIKSVGLIAVLTLISRALGLFRDVITASKFGTTSQLDMFTAASNIPNILFMTIGTAIVTTFIPLYNRKRSESKDEAVKFTSNVLNFFILVTLIISIVCIIFIKPISAILNPGFKGSKLDGTAMLSIILIPTLIFNAIIYIFNGFLQSENNFSIPALISLPLNIITILFLMIFGTKFGVLGLTIATFIATFCQIIPQIPYIKKLGYKYSLTLDLKDPQLKDMGIMIIPVIIGTGVQQINTFVERAFAGKFGTGRLSMLSYAYRVFTLFVDIFVTTISTVIYPMMSRITIQSGISELKKTLMEYLSLLIVLIIPINFIVLAESRPIIFTLFQRGNFNANDTYITQQILFFYSFGLLAYGIRDFICKAFYTLNDTRTPMINSGIAMGLNIVLIIIYKSFMGLNGLAFANATSTYIACILLIVSLRRKIGNLGLKKNFITLFKTLAASGVMLSALLLLNKVFLTSYNSTIIVLFKLCIFAVSGLIIYIIIGYMLRLEEIKRLVLVAKNKVLNRNFKIS